MNGAKTQTHVFRIQGLDEACELAERLASYFPCAFTYGLAMRELLINAVEHGNLEICLQSKAELLRRGEWRQEVERRMLIPPYSQRWVDVYLRRDEDECYVRVADQGGGFPWRDYYGKLLPQDLPNGRGLWLVYHTPFDYFGFSPAGNEVTCVVRLPKPSGEPPAEVKRVEHHEVSEKQLLQLHEADAAKKRPKR